MTRTSSHNVDKQSNRPDEPDMPLEDMDEIDELLVRYLGLLDTYTTLRSEINQLQSSIHQSIARANFLAERGIRYGQDHYDDRIQATRKLVIAQDQDEQLLFTVVDSASTQKDNTAVSDTSVSDAEKTQSEDSDLEAKHDLEREEGGDEQSETAHPRPVPKQTFNTKDPIRMFGLIVPQAIRIAQGHSITMVENFISKLVNTDLEMKAVEIEVRRARKKAAKSAKTSRKIVTTDETTLQSIDVDVGALRI